ncbi:kinesin-like protein, partial [Trifolium pratense]
MMVGVNVPDSWLGDAASALCYKVGKIFFLYLGLPIGVIRGVKTAWVNWKTICVRKEYGGLGVRQLKGFNLTLLGRVLVSKGADGSGSMSSKGWGMGLILFSGRIHGWMRFLMVRGACLQKGGGDQITYSGRDVLSRVGDRWGGLGVAKAAQSSNRWQWQSDPDTGYTVRGAYRLLTTLDSVTLEDVEHLIWHPQVPLKVSIFVWHLLRDRLPTKSNLVTRGVLSSAALFCVSGCGVAESAYHLFISYSFFGSLWTLVRTWIDISSTGSTTIRDHFVRFTYSTGGSRARRSFLPLIWLASIWVVWTERNHRLLRGSTSTPHQLLDKIKFFSY